MSSRHTVVVKFGGSLGSHPAARAARRGDVTAAAASGITVVIVPGGGRFADAVRQAQSTAGFDDATAHDMALLAMAQTGYVLASVLPRTTRLARGLAEILSTLAERPGIPLIWQPDPRCDGLELERSWRVTSDSLALWLASRIDARRVILVKSCAIPSSSDNAPPDLTELARMGIVDGAYPDLALTTHGIATTLIYAGQSAALKRALAASN
jgi:aspartokinase-like uncharacterized kinase